MIKWKDMIKMALISCPKCGQSVSDKAAACPHCGAALFTQSASLSNMRMCSDCGTEYKGDLSFCPLCGCPNPDNEAKPQKSIRKRNAMIAAFTLFAFVIIAVSAFGLTKKLNKEQYYSAMESVAYTMLEGAGEAETAGRLIKNVWYNSIYEEKDESTDKYTMQNGIFVDDFNDALSNLFRDADHIESVSYIKDNQSQVSDLMKELQNPPKEHEEAYSVLKTYYDNYLEITNLVVNPTGNYDSYSEKYNTSVIDTANSYEKMTLYLE